MAAQDILELIMKTKKQGNAAKETANDLKEVGKAADETKKKSEAFSKGIKIAEGAVIATGLAILKSIPQLVELGIQSDRARVALEAYAGGGEEAAAMLEAVSDAAGGTLDKLSAMQNATRLLSMGLASNAQEAAQLTDIAVTLGSTMGKGPQAAFEEFTLLLANQSILRLDTFGISGANVRQRMEELAAATGETDRQTLFLTATMEEATKKMDALDAAGYKATNNIDRLTASAKNAYIAVAEWLADGLMPWIDGIMGVRDALDLHQQEMLENTDTYEEFTEEMVKAASQAGILGVGFTMLTRDEYELAKQTGESIGPMRTYTEAIDGATASTITLSEQTVASADLILREWDKAALARKAIDALTEALDQGWISQDAYNQEMIKIGINMLDLPGAQLALSSALQALDADLAAGKITAGEYAHAVWNLYNGLEALPDHIKVVIEVEERWKPGPLTGGDGTRRRQHGGPVWSDEMYLVGEAGPELFIPQQHGVILPANQTQNVVNNTFNLSASYAMQNEASLSDDVRMLMQLYGRR